MLKESTVAYFNVISLHFPGSTEEDYETLTAIWDLNQAFPEQKSEANAIFSMSWVMWWMGKAVMIYLEILFRHFLGGTKGNHETRQSDNLIMDMERCPYDNVSVFLWCFRNTTLFLLSDFQGWSFRVASCSPRVKRSLKFLANGSWVGRIDFFCLSLLSEGGGSSRVHCGKGSQP
jgi:hypothetical protein